MPYSSARMFLDVRCHSHRVSKGVQQGQGNGHHVINDVSTKTTHVSLVFL